MLLIEKLKNVTGSVSCRHAPGQISKSLSFNPKSHLFDKIYSRVLENIIMKLFRHLIIFSILLACHNVSYSVPALRQTQIYIEPNGCKTEIIKVGDESIHFISTKDGILLHIDKDGFISLGKLDEEGCVVSTGSRLEEIESEKSVTFLSDIDFKKIEEKRNLKRISPRRGPGLTSTTYPHTGSPKGLIILVEYTDVKFMTPDARAYFQDMINGENFTLYNGTGSVVKYFSDQSQGLFTPSFDVMGPVTLPNEREYYGGNVNGADKNAYQMVLDAVDILDESIDFSQYDNDGDGAIDNIYLFYAGQGEADYGGPDTVWPHSWDIRWDGINKEVDGVKLGKYGCSNEWSKNSPVGLGTFVHEFSHVLGLPDLYPTNRLSNDYTPGSYSVLDQGPYNNEGRTPPNYSSYELNALDWIEPIILEEPKTVILNSIQSGEIALIPTKDPNEFFLFENRQMEGWDSYIPNHGLLIWHIDYDANVFQNNAVNNDRNHPRVDLIKANNNNSEPAGFPFPGTSGATAFTSETQPSFKTWDGTLMEIPITDIKEKNNVITFDVAGGGFKMTAPGPKVTEWSEKDGYFMIEWDKVEGVVDYFVSVFTNDGSQLGCIFTGFDESQLPEGWNASAVSWNTTVGSYGEKSPSYKFGKDNQILRSPQFEDDITGLEYWAKGTASENSHILIEGCKGGEWYDVFEYHPEGEESENIVITDFLPQTKQIRFTMKRDKGSILLDDVIINFGDKGERLDDYDNVTTGNYNSLKVENLIDINPYYYFRVAAWDGEFICESPIVYFELKGEAQNAEIESITNSETDFYENILNLKGQKIKNPEKGKIIIINTPEGYKKIVNK